MKNFLKEKKSLIKRMLRKIEYMFKGFICNFFHIFPIKKKIIITNYEGRGFGDNAKSIVENIHKKFNDYDLVWVVKNKNIKIPHQIRTVNIKSLKYIYEMATSKIWIDNCRQYSYIEKRKGQFYIQTWHGAPALKKIEKDAEKSLSKLYLKNSKTDSTKIDLFISNSSWMTKLIKSSFWYKGKILECGSPRNDVFFESDFKKIEKKVRDYCSISEEKRIILYAPTFRKDSNLNNYDINFKKSLSELSEKFNNEFKFLIRLHPNIAEKSKEIAEKNDLIDVTFYDDMQELLIASDIVITDYSSLMFDFSLLKKPCFLYCKDIQDYKNDRGIYFEFEELPFPLAENNSQLIDKIKNFSMKSYQKKIEKFHKEIGYKEYGNATNKIIEVIKEKMEESL